MADIINIRDAGHIKDYGILAFCFRYKMLEGDYTQMFCEDIVEGGTLIGNPSEQQISDLKMKYGILWTENIKDDIIKS